MGWCDVDACIYTTGGSGWTVRFNDPFCECDIEGCLYVSDGLWKFRAYHPDCDCDIEGCLYTNDGEWKVRFKIPDDCCGAQNTCNSCDPAIPDALDIAFAGLSGDFASYNGTIRVNWVSSCVWQDVTAKVELEYLVMPQVWRVTIDTGVGLCTKSWAKSDSGGCTPTGAYTESNCDDTDCTDSDSCADSAGATCVVSTT